MSFSSSSREDAGLKLARTIWLGFWLKGRAVEGDRGVEVEEAWLVESFLTKDGVGAPGVPGVFSEGVGGPSKSQETPCLWQLPQTGCTAGSQVEPTRRKFRDINLHRTLSFLKNRGQ